MVGSSALYAGRVCGRFSITGDLDFYAEYFGVDEVTAEELGPSWNVAPTDEIYVISESEGRRKLGSMRWGLIPPLVEGQSEDSHQRSSRDHCNQPCFP